MFWRWLSNSEAAAGTQVVFANVIKMVPPPSRTACSVAPPPIVPVIAADSVTAVIAIVGVAVIAPADVSAVAGTVTVMVSVLAIA